MNHQNEDHLDLRQKKTRRLLVEALAQLLTERPFQELSVVDICRPGHGAPHHLLRAFQ